MNSRRHTITSLSIVLLAVTIMSVSAIGQNAYAAGGGMSLSADCSGSSCDISGTTDRNDKLYCWYYQTVSEYMALIKWMYQVVVTLHQLT